MNKYVEADLYRYTGKTNFKSLLFCLTSIPGFKFLFFFRLSRHYKKYSLPGIVCNLLYKRYYYKYGIQIPKGVQIGKGFFIHHFGGIVINSRTVIGNNCNILQNVTIGNTKGGKRMGAPVIGDRVYLGPGAVVVGGIKVGNNVLIAPNAYVNFDVPDNSIVIGNPGKVIPNDSATFEYITNTVA